MKNQESKRQFIMKDILEFRCVYCVRSVYFLKGCSGGSFGLSVSCSVWGLIWGIF